MKAWTLSDKPERPIARSDHTGCIYNDKIYVFGGELADGSKLNGFWEFDIENSSWKQVETHTIGPSGRAASSCAQIGNFFYIFGGSKNADIELNDLFRFSFETSEWIQLKKKKNHPTARHYSTLNPLQIDNDPCLILFAGHLGNRSLSDELFIYDIKTDTWIQKRSHKIRRYGHTSVIYKNKLFVFAGHIKSDNIDVLSNDLIEYDIETDTWKDCFTLGQTPSPRKGHQSVVIRDSMFVLGSIKDPDLHEFSFLENRWYTYQTNFKIPLFGHNLYAHHKSNSIFLFGGFNNNSGAFTGVLQLNVGNPRRTLVDCFNTFFEKSSFFSDLTINFTCEDGFKVNSDEKELIITGPNVKTKIDEIEGVSKKRTLQIVAKQLEIQKTKGDFEAIEGQGIADRVKKRKRVFNTK